MQSLRQETNATVIYGTSCVPKIAVFGIDAPLHKRSEGRCTGHLLIM